MTPVIKCPLPFRYDRNERGHYGISICLVLHRHDINVADIHDVQSAKIENSAPLAKSCPS